MRVLMLGIVVAIAAIMPASATAEDQQIADFIKARLMQEKQQGNLFGFNVDMRVDRGTVWFKGFVSNRSQELLILRTAQLAGHLGVVQVVDDIEVNAPQGPNAQQQVSQQQMMQQQQMAAMKQQQYQMQQMPNQLPDRMAMRPNAQKNPAMTQQQLQQMQQAQQQQANQLQMQQQMMQQRAMHNAQQGATMPQPPVQRQPLPSATMPQMQRSNVPMQTPSQPRTQMPPARRMHMPMSDAGSNGDSNIPKVDEATQEADLATQKVAYQEPIPASPMGSVTNDYQGQLPASGMNGIPVQPVASSSVPAPPQPIASQPVAAAQPLPFARAATPADCQSGFCGGYDGYGGYGQPVPSYDAGYGGGYGAGYGGGAGISSDSASLPGYSWPSYAAHPNYGAVSYPKQYSPSAWPYIGPFYPYPQVPLGWRKVSLEWDDGWWFLDFHDKN